MSKTPNFADYRQQVLSIVSQLAGTLAEPESLIDDSCHQQNRINSDSLSVVIEAYPDLQLETPVCSLPGQAIVRKAIYDKALQFDFAPLSRSQLHWRIQESNVLTTVQPDVPDAAREQLLAGAGQESAVINSLWMTILSKLGLQADALHPEALQNLSLSDAEDWLVQQVGWNKPEINASSLEADTEIPELSILATHEQCRQQASDDLDQLLAELGERMTLCGFVLALGGVDVLANVQPQLQRVMTSVNGDSMAWRLPGLESLGLYGAWRAALRYDANRFLYPSPDWQTIRAELPEEALTCIIMHLFELDIAPAHWEAYLRRLLLDGFDLPDSANWLEQYQNQQSDSANLLLLTDYFAIRLTLDRLWLNQACHDLWKVEAKVGALENYFRKNLSELFVRKRLYEGSLPEYLLQEAEALLINAGSERQCRQDWQHLADRILTWQLSPLSENPAVESPGNTGWRLFRLCQHLGLNAGHVELLDKSDLLAMLAALEEFECATQQTVF